MKMLRTPSGRSDAELLRLIQEGNDQALREAFDKYAYICFSAAVALLKSRDLCVDVVVEIFKAVRANANEIKDLRAYIFDKARELTTAGLHEIARKYLENEELQDRAETNLSRNSGVR